MVAGNGLYFPILGFASCVAFIYMSFGDFILGYHKEPEFGFVGRNGTQFMLDGGPFYINGWNSYWLMDHAVQIWVSPCAELGHSMMVFTMPFRFPLVSSMSEFSRY